MDPIVKAIDIIRRFEGLLDGDPNTVNLDPYLDPIGIWTIGWGHVVRDEDGKSITGKENEALARAMYPGGITIDEAKVLLRDDIRGPVIGINKLVKVPLKDYQLSALISFVFNVGLGNFKASTMLTLINASEFGKAALEFPKWRKSGGKILNGLIVRRAAEAACFLGKV